MFEEKPYKTVLVSNKFEIEKVKGSRFIASIFPITDEDDIKQKILSVYDKKANHHCYAYRLSDKTKFYDDGEPTGSAGKPILAPILGNELFYTLIIITRFFGGTKLGVGGLVRAYGQAANSVITNSKIITITPKYKLKLKYNYDDSGAINSALNLLKLENKNLQYLECIHSEILVDFSEVILVKETLIEYTAARIVINEN